MVPKRTLCTTELYVGSLPVKKFSIDRIRTGTRAGHYIKEARIAINGDMRLTLVERSLKMGNKDRKKDKKKPKKTATKTGAKSRIVSEGT